LTEELRRTTNRLETINDVLTKKLGDSKEDFKDRLGDLDKYYSEQMEELSTNIE